MPGMGHVAYSDDQIVSTSGAEMVGRCVCCGSDRLVQATVLWQGLIDEWRLAPAEAQYIDRQQGIYCPQCLTNYRGMALAAAIMQTFGYVGWFKDFVVSDQAQTLRILEINEAANLTPYLSQIPGHTLASYPDVDMLQLPFPASTWDLVVHSDTLEHVPHPIRALAECHRVLSDDGVCAFTIPIIVGRLTQSRAGLPPSYHGTVTTETSDYLVQSEFGADAWTYAIRAGFPECRICALDYPAAQAFVCMKRQAWCARYHADPAR